MPTQTLNLRMQSSGSRSTSRDVDRVGRSVRGVGNDSNKATKHVSIFSRALLFMQVRGIVVLGILGLLSAAVVGLSPALILATGGMLALAASFGPLIALGVGALQRFHDTAGVAGSAASELTDVLAGLRHAWNVAISPGAAILMRGLSRSIVTLLPLIEAMRGPMTAFARAVGTAMDYAAGAISAMRPELMQLLTGSAQLVGPLTDMMVAFFGAFVDGANAGLPAALVMVGWLTDFGYWLQRSIAWMDEFARSAGAIGAVETIFHVIGSASKYVAGVSADLAGIIYQVALAFSNFWSVSGDVVLWGLRLLASVLQTVNENFKTLQPIVVVLGGAFLAQRTAVRLLAFGFKLAAFWTKAVGIAQFIALGPTAMLSSAFWALNAALYANPIGIVIVALAAIAAAIYLAYTKSEWFRNAVHNVWQALKGAWTWIKDNWGTIGPILLAPFKPLLWLIRKIVENFDKIKNFAGGAIGKIAGAAGSVGGVVGSLVPHLPHLAGGGTVTRGGAVAVHERGGEVMDLPTGTRVFPHDSPPPAADAGGQFYVEAVFVLPDGEVVSRQVVKASRKSKAAR